MASRFTPAALTSQIEGLLARREEHQSAIDTIDATLEKIGSMLNLPGRSVRGAKAQSNGRRKRGRFAMSGEESILAFVRKAGSPTTRDVNQHWKSEGRGGTADNALTKLVKLKKLKRSSAKGQRGSQYAIA